MAGVVGDEADRLARGAQLGERLGGPPGAGVAHPNAAVEIEQHVVIRLEHGGESHGTAIIAARSAILARRASRNDRVFGRNRAGRVWLELDQATLGHQLITRGKLRPGASWAMPDGARASRQRRSAP